MAQNPPAIRISKWNMRRLFNEGRFYEQVVSGELTARKENEYNPLIVSENIPLGSRSFETFYYDRHGNVVAQVQRFVTPQGTIGASGKVDPKRLHIKGVTYAIVKKNRPQPPRLTNRRINQILDKQGIDAIFTYPRGWLHRTKGFWYAKILRRIDP